jgi:hypothetical protein
MTVEPLLSFNGAGAYEQLGQQFEVVILKMTETVMEYARQSLPGDEFYGPVRDTLQGRLVQLASTGIVTGQIGSDVWESWIAEWGSGSEMDRVNPGITSYMSSDLWNPDRAGFAITGRPEGPYLAIDGTIHDSSGKLAGVDLEVLAQTDSEFQAWMMRVGLPSDAFQPKLPYHVIRNALETYRGDILDQLNAVLRVFNFGTFFV